MIEAAAGNILQKAGVPAGDAVLHRQPKPRRYGGLGDIEYLRYHRIQFFADMSAPLQITKWIDLPR